MATLARWIGSRWDFVVGVGLFATVVALLVLYAARIAWYLRGGHVATVEPKFAADSPPPLLQPAVEVPEDEMFQKLWIQWQLYQKYGREGFAKEANYAKGRLERFTEWPAISDACCRLFGHAAFTQATWDRLEGWLLAHHAANREAMYRMSRSQVAGVLQAAVAVGASIGGHA